MLVQVQKDEENGKCGGRVGDTIASVPIAQTGFGSSDFLVCTIRWGTDLNFVDNSGVQGVSTLWLLSSSAVNNGALELGDDLLMPLSLLRYMNMYSFSIWRLDDDDDDGVRCDTFLFILDKRVLSLSTYLHLPPARFNVNHCGGAPPKKLSKSESRNNKKVGFESDQSQSWVVQYIFWDG